MGSKLTFSDFLSCYSLDKKEAKELYESLLPREKEISEAIQLIMSRMVINENDLNTYKDFEMLNLLKRFKEEGAWQD